MPEAKTEKTETPAAEQAPKTTPPPANGTRDLGTMEPSPRTGGLQSVRVVHDAIAAFDTGKFEHMQRLATVLANSSLVPDHLKGNEGPAVALANCFLVVSQAHR